MTNTSDKNDLNFINPNWSAFVLLVLVLSMFNSWALLLPLPQDAKTVLTIVNVAVSFILWADFIYLLRQSPDKHYFMVKQHGWMVLLGSLPLFRFVRLGWFWLMLRKNGRSFREFLSHIVIKRSAEGTLLSISFMVIVIFQTAVVSILYFEEATPDGNITSVSDAFWWAFSTVTTVGYGDRVPVTNEGRIVAALLMAVGIALFSVITGSLAQWFRGHQAEQPRHVVNKEISNADTIAAIWQLIETQENAHQQSIAELKKRLADLEANLERDGV